MAAGLHPLEDNAGTTLTLMNYQSRQSFKRIFSLQIIGLVLIITSIGCAINGAEPSSPTPVVRVTLLPVVSDNPTSTPTVIPSPTNTKDNIVPPRPDGTSAPTTIPNYLDPEFALNLTILAPTQGAGLEVGAIRVFGVTLASAKVTVNGIPTDVSPDGTFARDLILGEGINSVLATAADASGRKVSKSLVVLYVPRLEGVPLSILFPQGLEVSDPNLTIMGATRPDAVIGVNGIPVEVNSFGIFSTAVVLEEGTNLIEVVAVDLDEHVNFQTVVVFYIP